MHRQRSARSSLLGEGKRRESEALSEQRLKPLTGASPTSKHAGHTEALAQVPFAWNSRKEKVDSETRGIASDVTRAMESPGRQADLCVQVDFGHVPGLSLALAA